MLLNVCDTMLRSPAGDLSVRGFLRFVDGLIRQLGDATSAAEHAKKHSEQLVYHLSQEREGRNSQGFSSALRAKEQHHQLEQERQARAAVEAELHSLRSKLAYSSSLQHKQLGELQGLSYCFAEAEIAQETSLRSEIRRQEDFFKAERDQAIAWMKSDCEKHVTESRRAQGVTLSELEEERATTSALREENGRLEHALSPWRTLLTARTPCVLELVRFLSEDASGLVPDAYPSRARLPVLAIEWLPETHINTSAEWPNLMNAGVYGFLDQLCTGDLRPEDVELTIWHVDGRWLNGMETEAPQLAALLAFQAFRPDISVAPCCRIVPMKRHALPRNILKLDPAKRSLPSMGSKERRGVGVPRPSSDEAMLRQVLRGCPMERDLLSALCYVHAANPEALRRNCPTPY